MRIQRTGPRNGKPRTVARYSFAGLFAELQLLIVTAEKEAAERGDCQRVVTYHSPPRVQLIGPFGKPLCTYFVKW